MKNTLFKSMLAGLAITCAGSTAMSEELIDTLYLRQDKIYDLKEYFKQPQLENLYYKDCSDNIVQRDNFEIVLRNGENAGAYLVDGAGYAHTFVINPYKELQKATEISIQNGESIDLSEYILIDDKITWVPSSTGANLGHISDEGIFEAIYPGTYTIQARSALLYGYKHDFTITIEGQTSYNQITTELEIYEGESLSAHEYLVFPYADDYNFQSYNPDMVSFDGTITAIKEGNSTVVAEISGKYRHEFKVNVKKFTGEPVVQRDTMAICAGHEFWPFDLLDSYQLLDYSSANESIATQASDGVIFVPEAGSTIITASNDAGTFTHEILIIATDEQAVINKEIPLEGELDLRSIFPISAELWDFEGLYSENPLFKPTDGGIYTVRPLTENGNSCLKANIYVDTQAPIIELKAKETYTALKYRSFKLSDILISGENLSIATQVGIRYDGEGTFYPSKEGTFKITFLTKDQQSAEVMVTVADNNIKKDVHLIVGEPFNFADHMVDSNYVTDWGVEMTGWGTWSGEQLEHESHGTRQAGINGKESQLVYTPHTAGINWIGYQTEDGYNINFAVYIHEESTDLLRKETALTIPVGETVKLYDYTVENLYFQETPEHDPEVLKLTSYSITPLKPGNYDIVYKLPEYPYEHVFSVNVPAEEVDPEVKTIQLTTTKGIDINIHDQLAFEGEFLIENENPDIAQGNGYEIHSNSVGTSKVSYLFADGQQVQEFIITVEAEASIKPLPEVLHLTVGEPYNFAEFMRDSSKLAYWDNEMVDYGTWSGEPAEYPYSGQRKHATSESESQLVYTPTKPGMNWMGYRADEFDNHHFIVYIHEAGETEKQIETELTVKVDETIRVTNYFYANIYPEIQTQVDDSEITVSPGTLHIHKPGTYEIEYLEEAYPYAHKFIITAEAETVESELVLNNELVYNAGEAFHISDVILNDGNLKYNCEIETSLDYDRTDYIFSSETAGKYIIWVRTPEGQTEEVHVQINAVSEETDLSLKQEIVLYQGETFFLTDIFLNEPAYIYDCLLETSLLYNYSNNTFYGETVGEYVIWVRTPEGQTGEVKVIVKKPATTEPELKLNTVLMCEPGGTFHITDVILNDNDFIYNCEIKVEAPLTYDSTDYMFFAENVGRYKIWVTTPEGQTDDVVVVVIEGTHNDYWPPAITDISISIPLGDTFDVTDTMSFQDNYTTGFSETGIAFFEHTSIYTEKAGTTTFTVYNQSKFTIYRFFIDVVDNSVVEPTIVNTEIEIEANDFVNISDLLAIEGRFSISGTDNSVAGIDGLEIYGYTTGTTTITLTSEDGLTIQNFNITVTAEEPELIVVASYTATLGDVIQLNELLVSDNIVSVDAPSPVPFIDNAFQALETGEYVVYFTTEKGQTASVTIKVELEAVTPTYEEVSLSLTQGTDYNVYQHLDLEKEYTIESSNVTIADADGYEIFPNGEGEAVITYTSTDGTLIYSFYIIVEAPYIEPTMVYDSLGVTVGDIVDLSQYNTDDKTLTIFELMDNTIGVMEGDVYKATAEGINIIYATNEAGDIKADIVVSAEPAFVEPTLSIVDTYTLTVGEQIDLSVLLLSDNNVSVETNSSAFEYANGTFKAWEVGTYVVTFTTEAGQVAEMSITIEAEEVEPIIINETLLLQVGDIFDLSIFNQNGLELTHFDQEMTSQGSFDGSVFTALEKGSNWLFASSENQELQVYLTVEVSSVPEATLQVVESITLTEGETIVVDELLLSENDVTISTTGAGISYTNGAITALSEGTYTVAFLTADDQYAETVITVEAEETVVETIEIVSITIEDGNTIVIEFDQNISLLGDIIDLLSITLSDTSIDISLKSIATADILSAIVSNENPSQLIITTANDLTFAESVTVTYEGDNITTEDGSIVDKFAITQEVLMPTSVENSLANTVVYPTETSSTITVESSEMINTVEVVSIAGIVHIDETVNSQSTTIDCSSLASGTYLIIITDESGEITTDQIIKK